MPHYKAPDNSLHFLDDDSFSHLLPAGSIQITDEEYSALAPQPDPKAVLLQTLAQADAPFTPRRMREFMLVVLEDKAAAVAAQMGVEKDVVLAANPAYQLVKTYDDMAAQARAKL